MFLATDALKYNPTSLNHRATPNNFRKDLPTCALLVDSRSTLLGLPEAARDKGYTANSSIIKDKDYMANSSSSTIRDKGYIANSSKPRDNLSYIANSSIMADANQLSYTANSQIMANAYLFVPITSQSDNIRTALPTFIEPHTMAIAPELQSPIGSLLINWVHSITSNAAAADFGLLYLVFLHCMIPPFCIWLHHVIHALHESIRYSKHYRHPASTRRAKRAQTRYRPRHLSYHAFKRRRKLRILHRFRRPGHRPTHGVHRKKYTVPKIPRQVITYLILRRDFTPSRLERLAALLYLTYIISRITSNAILHLIARWIVPPIIFDLLNWLYGHQPTANSRDDYPTIPVDANDQQDPNIQPTQDPTRCSNSLSDMDERGTRRPNDSTDPAKADKHDISRHPTRDATTDTQEVQQGNQGQNQREILAHASIKSTSTARKVHFDTDSFIIGVDTHATQCISPNPHHFEDMIPISDMFCQGFEGQRAEVKGSGTFVFNIEDDDGATHIIRIPNSLYIPTATKVLLVPQHWAQEANDTTPIRFGTMCQSVDNGVILYWNQQRYKKTISLDPRSNVPVFRTAASSSAYDNYAANPDVIEASPAEQVFELTPDGQRQRESYRDYIGDEDILRNENDNDSTNSHDDTVITNNRANTPSHNIVQEGPLRFELSSKHSIDPHQSHQATTLQAELMRWHYRLGHLPFSKIRILANNGEIPKYLAKVTPPFCAACMYGAMHRIRKRNGKYNQIHRATKAGQCVSVDQLESTQIGFIAQMKGKLTKDHYTAATVFVDHYSRARYVHLMKDLTSEETIRAKAAFEQWAILHGVTIQHYHCDNGRFADRAFLEACAQQRQVTTFCGVNSHHQNGIAERHIRDLQDQARKQLLFAKQRWPQAIDLALWPYALRNANECYNMLRTESTGKSPLEVFANVTVGSNMHHMHTFGCPVYALRNELASGNSLPKWTPRCRLGINLGRSPRHARSVNLVLNPYTGLVSPQFHVKYDEFFETVDSTTDSAAVSNWKGKAGLVTITEQQEDDNSGITIANSDAESDSSKEDEEEEEEDQEIANIATTSTSSRGRVRRANVRHKDYVTSSAAEAIKDNPREARDTPKGTLATKAHNSQSVSRPKRSSRAAETCQHQRSSELESEQTNYAEAHDELLSLQERMRDPIAFAAEMEGDIMYYHQAMKQKDADKFSQAVVKEIQGHVDNNNWTLIPAKEVPEGEQVLDSVWAMRRKRDLTTNEITKYKARLNVHGGMQTYGLNYFETYAPVVTWVAIRLLLIIAMCRTGQSDKSTS
ncbi:hypothetical protein THAOC_02121 [Thalassiosira oceanica]|uniref:Integrase catalytic domain-containing protein n=1 Tax=Thalassiosira oceanica TaxID=159749 RepID=K0TBQ3_THAOC|nr:hypothetical protein THAOC_02121 [Thalassiosira oceanica]|eukprot:EJK76133.1 hypothetical protein THAOC_02121 [Thalassiosira oceanica]